MSWTKKEYAYSCLQRLALNVLKQGEIPKHVAFIMDGNRRFAVSEGMEKTQGHAQGFSKLSETLQWCHDFGVKEVSVYAFSIDNFKRSRTEVSFLMELAVEKMKELIEKKDQLTELGVKVRIIGNIYLLPRAIQHLAAKLMLATKNNTQATLNIMMAYTTHDELTNAVESIRKGVQNGIIYESDISPEVITSCSYLRHSRPVDLLVRTSGEVRLSDFMVWEASAQSSATVFSFFKTYWPAFSFWDMAASILHFQFNRSLSPGSPSSDIFPDLKANGNGVSTRGVGEDIGRQNRLVALYNEVESNYQRQLVTMSTDVSSDCDCILTSVSFISRTKNCKVCE